MIREGRGPLVHVHAVNDAENLRKHAKQVVRDHRAGLITVAERLRRADGQTDVVPVAFELDHGAFWIGGGGETVLATRKVRNIASGQREVPVRRTGLVGPGSYLRIAPTMSWSWNLDGQPVGEEWYASRRAEHDVP